MNADHDSVIIPTLHDTLSDVRTGGAGMADEAPADDDSAGRHRADDPAYVADMQRLEAARAIGYTDTLCLACGSLLFVPVEQRCGETLCPQCEREGAALAADEDGDDTDLPPAASAPIPERSDPEYFVPCAGMLADDSLVSAVDLADRDPRRLGLDTPDVQAAALSAFSAEVLRRLDVRKAA